MRTTGQPTLSRDRELVEMRLLKAVQDGDKWEFHGIASDESLDVEGDSILKKSLDLSYAQQRGYVNWDHDPSPASQIGYLTTCQIIGDGDRAKIEDTLETKLEKTASVYTKGVLYPYVDRAIEVQKILKSVPGNVPALGMSLDGSVFRSKDKVLKAFVRGVAITPKPAHALTSVQLAKSLAAAELVEEEPLSRAEVKELVEGLLAKSLGTGKALTYDEAVLWVLRKRPKWPYELADQFVQHTISTRSKE